MVTAAIEFFNEKNGDTHTHTHTHIVGYLDKRKRTTEKDNDQRTANLEESMSATNVMQVANDLFLTESIV